MKSLMPLAALSIAFAGGLSFAQAMPAQQGVSQQPSYVTQVAKKKKMHKSTASKAKSDSGSGGSLGGGTGAAPGTGAAH